MELEAVCPFLLFTGTHLFLRRAVSPSSGTQGGYFAPLDSRLVLTPTFEWLLLFWTQKVALASRDSAAAATREVAHSCVKGRLYFVEELLHHFKRCGMFTTRSQSHQIQQSWVGVLLSLMRRNSIWFGWFSLNRQQKVKWSVVYSCRPYFYTACIQVS